MPSGKYTPSASVTALRRRAEAVAPGTFEAEIRVLFYLAGEWHKAVKTQDDGSLRDVRREFGLQFRATSGAVREMENELAARVVERNWKAELND